MRHHLLVVSEKKIKMSKTSFVIAQVKYYRWRHNSFLRLTHLGYKHVHNIRAKSGALCWYRSYALYTFDRNGNIAHNFQLS